jgi:hypothetical protein
VEATDANGEKVMVPKTKPEETVPSVRTQRGAIFSRAEQDRLANANLKAQQDDGGSPPIGASGTASPQADNTASLPATTTGAPARGGATRSSTTRPRGQE